MIIPLPLLVLIQGAFNRAIALDPDAVIELQALEGKVVEVQVTNLDVNVFAIIVSDGVELSRFHDGEPDTTLSGSLFDLLSLLKDPEALMNGTVSIAGDVTTAKQLKKIANNLDIDWEEHFSGLIGDSSAHQLFRFGSGIQALFARGAERFEQSAENFIKTGSASVFTDSSTNANDEQTGSTQGTQSAQGGIAVNHADVNSYCQSVDDLRSDLDRLEARLVKFETTKRGSADASTAADVTHKTGD